MRIPPIRTDLLMLAKLREDFRQVEYQMHRANVYNNPVMRTAATRTLDKFFSNVETIINANAGTKNS